MKRIASILLILIVSISMYAYMPYYEVKGKLLMGGVLPHTTNLQGKIKGPTAGFEVGVEFLPQGKYTWEKYWGMPIVGVGLTGMYLGNQKVFGEAVAVYPYLLVPIVRHSSVNFYFKVGAGLAVLTSTYYDTNRRYNYDKSTKTYTDLLNMKDERTNIAIGSHLNVFLPIGFTLDFPIRRGFSVTADAMLNHMSNGSFIQPNTGLNVINGFVGVSYRPNWREYMVPWNDYTKDMPKDWQMDFELSGGARQLYYRDNFTQQEGGGYSYSPKFNGVAMANISFYKTVCNFYKIGASADAFYDGVYVAQGESILKEAMASNPGVEYTKNTTHTEYGRYYIKDDKLSNKFRVGVSLDNAFVIGRVTMNIGWGLYVYDPIRNAYPIGTNPRYEKTGVAKRPFVYAYNIEKEDGWNYFKLQLKCDVWDHLYVSANLKTHLQKAEFFTIGIGYTFHFPTPAEDFDRLF